MADLDDIRARLADLAEELADLALDRLREATSLSRSAGRPAGREDGDGDAVARATAEERRLTRARRSVERAVAILSDGDDGET